MDGEADIIGTRGGRLPSPARECLCGEGDCTEVVLERSARVALRAWSLVEALVGIIIVLPSRRTTVLNGVEDVGDDIVAGPIEVGDMLADGAALKYAVQEVRGLDVRGVHVLDADVLVAAWSRIAYLGFEALVDCAEVGERGLRVVGPGLVEVDDILAGREEARHLQRPFSRYGKQGKDYYQAEGDGDAM